MKRSQTNQENNECSEKGKEYTEKRKKRVGETQETEEEERSSSWDILSDNALKYSVQFTIAGSHSVISGVQSLSEPVGAMRGVVVQCEEDGLAPDTLAGNNTAPVNTGDPREASGRVGKQDSRFVSAMQRKRCRKSFPPGTDTHSWPLL
ncbi:hypothetical protein E2C01_003775 [Portunus trituberculatus]|uniref:Uncharacterized protein n=1 Tax=Portunus trituberculatus TaxID=210409 RepID=A0A5B7CQN7_PORTR|nr:hypothetical protein [Portunus trituberculatus]